MQDKIRDFLTSTIFLKDIKCLFCGKELKRDSRYCICDECNKSLPYINGKVCHKCGEPINSQAEFCIKCKNHVDRGFDMARAVFLYRGAMSNAIKQLKYFGKKYYAPYLSKFLLDVYYRDFEKCDVVVPAPISKKSLKARGFNQGDMLCQSFADAGFDVNTHCVEKVLETQNQASLGYKERQTNLIGAFKVVDKSAVKNKNVLLVDDVFTTGATATEISECLKKAGAKRVDVVTLCHEMPQNATN